MPTLIKRTYSNLAGVDFNSDASKVLLNRSPNCVNMYKDYNGTQGQCIETRPGYKKITTIGSNINGMYVLNLNNSTHMVVHSGSKLYKWSNYPSTPTQDELKELYTSMNNYKTSFFIFDSKLYINDGVNYLVYDGNNVNKVSEEAYIPTTSIGRTPTGGGEILEPINVLSIYRKNTFVGDGASKEYYLDAVGIDNSSVKAYVNNIETTLFSVDYALGKVLFATAPAKPDTEGQSNVSITFSKTRQDYLDRIQNATLSLVFDGRIFFSGNKSFPNAIFNSQLQTPSYVSDLNYYQDGENTSKIKSMTIGNNLLWIFKESNQQNATVFYHIPTLDNEYGKVYPSKQGNISAGCYSVCCNFLDDIVFMSKQGLEGITGNIEQEQSLSHRSSLVDSKLTNENNFELLEMCEWNGYLLCLVNGHVYLADSRQKFQGINGYEYEWYYWDNINSSNGIATVIKEYKGDLLFGCDNGDICIFGGSSDDGNILYSCWTMPNDTFGYENHLKTSNKRGGIAKIKTIPNGQIKISVETDKRDEQLIKTFSSTGFDFTNIDFDNFSFTTKNESYIVYKVKQKKFTELKMKFYSDELDKPFGLYDSTIESYIGGYVKR